MMLQFNLLKRQESPQATNQTSVPQQGNNVDVDDDEQTNEALAREQIKRMMNKMQEMQLKHQEQLQVDHRSGAINVNRRQGANCRPQQDPTMRDDESSEQQQSHELIKRRFFEKLERRKSIGNLTTTTPNASIMRNFMTTQRKLSNLREESEYAYGFCASSNGCEIVVDEQQANSKDDYLNNNNNQLFVCDSAQTTAMFESRDDTITCEVKNDNALTGELQVDEKEAVYLTLDWKNVQANDQQMAGKESNSNSNNKEQSSSIVEIASKYQTQNGRSDVAPPAAIEQKQIKPLAAASQNNKPPTSTAADMHSEYKHPVPVDQQQQQQQQVSQDDDVQVLVGCGRRVNEADLVILPKKSVNSNNQRVATSSTRSMRKNSLPGRARFLRSAGQPTSSESSGAARLSRARRHSRRLLKYSTSQQENRRSCSSGSTSSSSLSSSSSGLTSSGASSVCSLERGERVPGILRLEQLSLSEDDLKSLISHSNRCRCSECRPSSKQSRCSGNYSPSATSKSSSSQRRRLPLRLPLVSYDEESLKKDDGSNSSSGNSSATRSLMNSLFHRQSGKASPQTISSSHETASATATASASATATATATAKSVPNLIVGSGRSLMMIRTRPTKQQQQRQAPSDSSSKFWSLFAAAPSIGPSHAIKANTPLPVPSAQPKQAASPRSKGRRAEQTSDDRDSGGQQHIYSAPVWQPKTAGYRLHLPVEWPPNSKFAAHPQQQVDQQPAYAPALANNSKYHSCSRHSHHHRSHNHNHNHHRHHHHRRRHHRNHHEERCRRSSSSASRRAQLQLFGLEAQAKHGQPEDGASQDDVWGQLIEINKLDGSQVLELERRAGKSWGFFVARGAINKTKGIFISRMLAEQQPSPLAALLGVGDQLLAIDEHQIGPDFDILRVNRLISKKSKILLKVKPFKG